MLAREHATLLTTATQVVSDLHGFRGRLRRGRIAHFQHDVFAERALSFAIYLSSALRLADAEEYISAYAVLRAALEHHLTDRLLFVGNRYTQQYSGVTKADYQRLERDRAQGRPGTEDIVGVTYVSGAMSVVRSGLHVQDESGTRRRQTLSIYYFLLDEFDPFVGTPGEQQHLSRGFTRVEDRIRHAEEQQGMYMRQLRWPRIKVNLRENRLCSEETLRRFDVHYRFLSAFVHPSPAGYDLVYGRNRPTGAPRYDHYASELALLYVNKLGAAELKYLKRMAARTPRVGLDGWPTVEANIRAADAAAAHLWFPGVDEPHAYDRVEEANSRGTRGERIVPMHRRPTPDDLQPHRVRYYRNPLRRLIKMHQSFHELTGFAYTSPWPREDARFRWSPCRRRACSRLVRRAGLAGSRLQTLRCVRATESVAATSFTARDNHEMTVRLGLLAYGSLQWDPGAELADVLDLVHRVDRVEAPFRIEFARSSKTRGGGPTLVPVESGGATVVAPVIPFQDRMSVREAQTLIWRREVRRTVGEYDGDRNPGPNKVYVDAYEGLSDAVEVVLAVRIGGNIDPLNADELAARAIRSAQTNAGARGADGISYLIGAKRCRIKTPLMAGYEAAICRRLDVGSLEETVRQARSQASG